MSKLMRQMSYMIIPGKEDKFQDLCDKFQALFDRQNKTRALGRNTTYSEDKQFLSMIIPGLDKKTKELDGLAEITRKSKLDQISQDWIAENGKKCKDYLEAFDKGKLKDNKQSFQKMKDVPISNIGMKSSTSDLLTSPTLYRDHLATIVPDHLATMVPDQQKTIVRGGAKHKKVVKSKTVKPKTTKTKKVVKSKTVKPKTKKVVKPKTSKKTTKSKN